NKDRNGCRYSCGYYCPHTPINYLRFKPAFLIRDLGDLGLAVPRQKKWRDPSILFERNLYLGHDRNAAWNAVETWRVQATAAMHRYIGRFVEMEMCYYGPKSYTILLRNRLSPSPICIFTNMHGLYLPHRNNSHVLNGACDCEDVSCHSDPVK